MGGCANRLCRVPGPGGDRPGSATHLRAVIIQGTGEEIVRPAENAAWSERARMASCLVTRTRKAPCAPIPPTRTNTLAANSH